MTYQSFPEIVDSESKYEETPLALDVLSFLVRRGNSQMKCHPTHYWTCIKKGANVQVEHEFNVTLMLVDVTTYKHFGSQVSG